jgi:hypothetical protein
LEILKLFARIGLKADQKQAENFFKSIQNIKIGLGVASIGAGVFVAALKKITDESMQTALSFKKFSSETGASMEELQKWQSVADEVSGSGQAVAESIKAITSNQEKIKLGQGNISGYQMLGINPNQSPFKILDQLREKTKGLSQAMKKNVMEQMGVNKDLLQTLELSKDKFDELKNSAFVIPESSIMAIDEARASSASLTGALKYLRAMITANLAPSIVKINKVIMEWIRNNKDGLIKGIRIAFDLISKFVSAIINTAKVINNLITNTIGWGNALKILVGIIAIMNASLLLSPIGLFTMGIILLIAVIDDLYRYSQGKKSLFGKLLDKNPKFKEMVDNIKDILKAFNSLFSKGDMKKFDELIDKWGIWGEILKSIATSLDAINAVKSLISGNKEEFLKTNVGKNREKQYNELLKLGVSKGGSSIVGAFFNPKRYEEASALNLLDMKSLLEDIKTLRTGSKKDLYNLADPKKYDIKIDIQGNGDYNTVKQATKDGVQEANNAVDVNNLGYQE